MVGLADHPCLFPIYLFEGLELIVLCLAIVKEKDDSLDEVLEMFLSSLHHVRYDYA